MDSTMLYSLFATILCLIFTVQGEGSRNDRESTLSKNIYVTINGTAACFRQMNATHQIGCSSSFNGNVGVLQTVESQASVDLIVSSGPHAPYIALVYPEFFTPETLERFQKSDGRVSGVLLLKQKPGSENQQPKEFSTDLQCPNEGYGLYESKGKPTQCSKWNPNGNGLMYRSWAFPIFFVVEAEQVKRLLDCYDTFNKPGTDGSPRDWPLCAAELKSFMLAAVDTPTCIRRNKINAVSISPSKVCDPLGDLNIWSTLVPSIQSEPHPETDDGSVIVIGARMDASSMFDMVSPGADTAATGMTAVLALVKQLAPLKETLKASNISNIYFILFNGEAFDYIGSSRIVYDILRNEFPAPIIDNTTTLPALLKINDIKYFIEFDQLAMLSGESYYIHRNWGAPLTAANNNSLPKLINILVEQGKAHNIDIVAVKNTTGLGLPPSSLQSFLAKDLDVAGVVITNHETTFRNKYYNSIFDNAEGLNYTNDKSAPDTVNGIAKLVATISSTIEQLVLEGKPAVSEFKPDPTSVDDILQCYVKSGRCDLFRRVTNMTDEAWKKLLPDDTDVFPLYVGVKNHINAITGITRNVMAYYQGVLVNRTEEKCLRTETDKMNVNYAFMDGQCFETSTSVSVAVSPAFIDDDNYAWTSGKYSTWTESVWQKLSVRIFLKPSMTHQVLTLSFGLAVFLLSIVIFSWINSKKDILFSSRVGEAIC